MNWPTVSFNAAYLILCALRAQAPSGARLFPGADAGGDAGNGFVAQMPAAFTGVIAVAMLELQEEARHAQRAKRGGERLVAGGAQFGGIKHFSFHHWILV